MRPSVTLFSAVFWLAGHCAFATPPPSDQVARSILYDANGRPSRAVFDAALKAKFPVGSSLAALADFFRELGGFCAKRDDGVTYRCEVAIEPCVNMVIASVEAKDDVIALIRYAELARTTCN